MKPFNPAAPADQDIIVARCDSVAESQAMAKWILPVLRDWPDSGWHLWVADATDLTAVKAAKLSDEGPLEWKATSYEAMSPTDAVCAMLGGHAGLVILAHHLVATDAARGLAGLVARLTRFPADDDLGSSLRKSFAEFGVKAAA